MIKIYGFIEDTFFQNKVSFGLEESRDRGVCFMDDDRVNYFDKKFIVGDTRKERLKLFRDGSGASGDLQFSFDGDKVKRTDIEKIDFNDRFFDLLETLYLSERSLEQLEETFEDDDNFHFLKKNSISRSVKRTSITINGEKRSVPNWFSFSIILDGDDGEEVYFKLFADNFAFDKDYPLYKICKVIPVTDPKYFLNPTEIGNEFTALVKSGEFSFDSLDERVKKDDHSGALRYSTRYILDPQNDYRIPFSILYKGAIPNSLSVRKAIREYLIGLGIAGEPVWKKIFPDLFITAQFFIVPMWDNGVMRPEGNERFPSVQKLYGVSEKMAKVFPTYTEEFIKEHLEVLNNYYSEIFSFSMPDPINELSFSIRELHETYQAHSPSSSVFSYQTERSKDFSLKFSKAIAILAGEENMTSEYLINSFNGRKYISFASYFVEYHVLFREDFSKGE